MGNDELGRSLADAVADLDDIDLRLKGVAVSDEDVEQIERFRVIAAIGSARRAQIAEDHVSRRSLLDNLAVGVLAVATLRLIVALMGFGAVLSSGAQNRWIAFHLVLFALAGGVLALAGAKDRSARALGVLFLVVSSAFATAVLPPVPTAGGAWGTLVWGAHTLQVESFLALALWLFVWLFPSEPRADSARRVGRVFLMAGAVVGTVLFASNLAIRLGLRPIVGSWLDLLGRGAPAPLYWPAIFVVALPAIPYLLWKSSVEVTASRRRVHVFVAALALGLSPFLLAVVASPFLPILADPVWRQWVGVVLYVALASIVPATIYAVLVDHVLDLHLVVHRTAQYALARYSVWCVGLLPLAVLAINIRGNMQVTFAEYLSSPAPLALLALSACSFFVLLSRHRLLRAVDRWFLREAADPTEALARLERDFRLVQTIRDTQTVLKREIERSLHPTTGDVLLVDETGRGLISLDGTVPRLSGDSTLLELLRSTRTETLLSYRAGGAVADLLPPDERRWLADTRFELFSPLLASNGSLLGVVGIGENRNGLPYSERDCMLITALSGQTALKLENSLLRRGGAGSGKGRLTLDWENEPATRCPACATMSGPGEGHCPDCDTPTVEAALPLVVKGKFRVDRFLGAGGAGVVYRAVDMALDRRVAIKTLPAIRVPHTQRLHREARAMAAVLHPNLALIYGAEQWRGMPLLIFEYLGGGTLKDVLARGPLQLDEVLDLGTVLADALDRVHDCGVLHRDIKPSNIGYTSGGVPKLLDFGLAAILDRSQDASARPAVVPSDPMELAELAWGADAATSLTVTQQLVGTPLYLSPEALAGARPAASFDLWSLALVLYEAFAGRHPLAGRSVADTVRRVRGEGIPDLRSVCPRCPPDFAAMLGDALSLDPARRPATAAGMRAELQALRARLFSTAS